jgi:hypothetical protein
MDGLMQIEAGVDPLTERLVLMTFISESHDDERLLTSFAYALGSGVGIRILGPDGEENTFEFSATSFLTGRDE